MRGRYALASTLKSPRRLTEVVLVITAGLMLTLLPFPLAAASIVGIAGVLGVLIQPLIGLWLLPFTVPFGSVRTLSLAGSSVGATDLLIALTLAAWLARGITNRRAELRSSPLLIPLLLLLGAMLLSFTDVYAVAPAFTELVKWVEIAAVYALTFNMIEDRRTAMILMGTLLLAGSLSALHGVAGSLLRVGPPQFAILGGRLYRAFGTFGQPNPFGGYVNHSLPIAVSLLAAALFSALQSPISNLQSRRRWLLIAASLVGASGILVVGLGLSWSRGAWLGAAAGLATVGGAWLFMLLKDERTTPALKRRLLSILWLVTAAGCVLLLVGGVGLLPASITARIDSAVATFTSFDARGAAITNANFATLERVAHWQAAWDMWRDYFWTGVGIGNYEAAYPDYRLPKWPYALGHAHNIYFNVGAEMGFIGLMAYLLFVGTALWHTWGVARRSSDLVVRGFSIGALGVLIALAVHNVFDNLYVHAMGIHLALVLGLVSATGCRDEFGVDPDAVI